MKNLSDVAFSNTDKMHRFIKPEPDLSDENIYGVPDIKTESDLDSVNGFGYQDINDEPNIEADGVKNEPTDDDVCKVTSSAPANLNGECSSTTGFIVGDNVCVEVYYMLLDTGASSYFITARAVETAGLAMIPCAPKTFDTCNGPVVRSKYVTFDLYIAGVRQTINAYIDEGPFPNSHEIILGTPAMKQFGMQCNIDFGKRHETRWTIRANVPRHPRMRYILRGAHEGARSTLRIHGVKRGLRIARRPGETAKQRDARQVKERMEARLRDAKLKHEKTLSCYGFDGDYRHDW